MYKFETLNSLFSCHVCNQLLKDPISLPCGETICKIHFDESLECFLCSETHVVPKSGFKINIILQKQLEIQLNTLNINFKDFDKCKLLIRELKASLNGIETLERDPAYYITEHFQELNRQVDLRREKLLLILLYTYSTIFNLLMSKYFFSK